ncbi:rhodanese domain-containing protein CG4456-like isoform X1 [Phlebotomus argentipes]|uniref:rhodanese domain-containing protein CG4456-like isoform X1 n=1 Tax=Phlebotomus argentipes TaxID=94469 RepID=UPI002892F0EB|nr:rhodanese domain-containing protein CG4456-like isoform X1 [Phlebotomus argentipes]
MLKLVKNHTGCCRWVYRGVFAAGNRAFPAVSRRELAIFTAPQPLKGLQTKISSCSPCETLRRSRSSQADTMKIATYEEVKDLCNHPEKLLIDVREPKELLETGCIPTSINIPLGQVQTIFSDDTSNENFRERFGRGKPTRDSQLIFMCKVGIRSDKAAQMVTQMGFRNAKNYKGSWTEWAEKEGLPAPK